METVHYALGHFFESHALIISHPCLPLKRDIRQRWTAIKLHPQFTCNGASNETMKLLLGKKFAVSTWSLISDVQMVLFTNVLPHHHYPWILSFCWGNEDFPVSMSRRLRGCAVDTKLFVGGSCVKSHWRLLVISDNLPTPFAWYGGDYEVCNEMLEQRRVPRFQLVGEMILQFNS